MSSSLTTIQVLFSALHATHPVVKACDRLAVGREDGSIEIWNIRDRWNQEKVSVLVFCKDVKHMKM